jgi:5'-3' exonuclease
MGKFTLIDANNWLRRKFEEDRDISGLRASVNSLRSEINNPNSTTIVFWDGYHANDYRKGIYPDYKSKRFGTPDEFYLQVDLFREIVKNLPVSYFRVDHYEADDLIAAFVRVLPEGSKVHIKSTDKDFEQLEGVTHEGKTLTDALQKVIDKAAEKGKPIVGADAIITPDLVVPFKVMVGDTSDSIAGIPGFGEKRWLLSDKEQIKGWFANNFHPDFRPDMSDKLADWCDSNIDLLEAMRRVCLFRPLDKDFLNANMQHGQDNPHVVEQILKDNYA